MCEHDYTDWEVSEEGDHRMRLCHVCGDLDIDPLPDYPDDYPLYDEEEPDDPLYRLRFSDAGSYTQPWLVDKHPLED